MGRGLKGLSGVYIDWYSGEGGNDSECESSLDSVLECDLDSDCEADLLRYGITSLDPSPATG